MNSQPPSGTTPPPRPERLRALLRRSLIPLALFVVSFGVLAGFAAERVLKPSADPHFVYLANAYLQGSLQLERQPPHGNDWASYEWMRLRSGQEVSGTYLDRKTGRFKTLDGEVMVIDRREVEPRSKEKRTFVSFPPMPAVLMVPLAAIWGYDVNDVLFTVFFGALNVALIFILLRRLSELGLTSRSRSENLWLTLLFGFGTVHFWCSVLGQVWFTALIVGATFTLLYVLSSLQTRHPLWAGVFLACGFATRTPLLFSAVFFAILVVFPEGRLRRESWRPALVKLVLFVLPPLVMGGLLLASNYLRFDSIFEFGHTYLADGQIARIRKFGLFNIHFLSKNLSAALTLLPRFQPDYPFVRVSRHGMSLLLTTPALLYLLRSSPAVTDAERLWRRAVLVTVVVVALPALLYQNTGYEQFGYRFSLDYTPYMVLLLALGRRRITWLFMTLVLVGVVVNGFGALTFKRFDQFYFHGSSFFDPD